MRFDSNQAWKDATALVSANRAVLSAVAGVFLVLPGFAVAILAPPPVPPAGAEPRALLELMSNYYETSAPWLLGMAALQIFGTLTMLALYTDRARPTVGEAMQLGLKGLLPTVLAQILAGMGFFLAALVPITLAGLTGSAALTTVAVLICIVGLVYGFVRISMVPPVVMVEAQRNPITALKRSWQLTGANAWRLLLFYVLLFIVFWVVVILLGGLADLALRFVVGEQIGAPLAAFISTALQAIMAIYFTAVYAATHRQLAGPSAGAAAAPFE
jgi:hypothetical protein